MNLLGLCRSRSWIYLGWTVVERAGSLLGRSINQCKKKASVLQVTGVEGPESALTVLIPTKSLKSRTKQGFQGSSSV